MRPSSPSSLPLGAVLVGGRSRRFGSPKALAQLDGLTLLQRACDALTAAGARPVLVGECAELESLTTPRRPDALPGAGPLGGIAAALAWASELGLPGTLCLACDLPFLSPALLRRLLDRGPPSGGALAPVGESGELEPLCAWYPVEAGPLVEARLRRRLLSLRGLLDELGAAALGAQEVAVFGRPSRLFHNVNRVEDLRAAGGMLREGRKDGGR